MTICICLINPPSVNRIRADYSDIIEKETSLYQPLSLQYLSSACKAKGCNVLIVDCQAEKLSCAQAIKKIALCNPQVIGVTCSTFTLIDTLELLNGLKAQNSNLPIIVGGPHATIFPKEMLSFSCVDVVVQGEGEEVLPEVIGRLVNNESLNGLNGVSYKENDKLILKSENAIITNLDSLALPDRTLPFNNYFTSMSRTGKVAIMMTSRGCPYQCIYCDRPAMGKKFRSRSAENVISEIEDCLQRGICEIAFFDDTFTIDRGRVVTLCELIIKKHLQFNWSARTRVDAVDLELLRLMKKAGCYRVSYGIESGNADTIAILRKGISLQQVRDAIESTKKAGIEILADFIIGSPGEDRKAILRTVNFAVALNVDYAQFTIMSLYPGTEIYRMALAQGLLQRDIWKEFASAPKIDFNTPIWPGVLTQKELEELLVFAYRRFYGRAGYLWNKLLQIKGLKDMYIKAKAAHKLLISGIKK
jgi:radical SAM superfamily enzyme YgiQ (UPF0313 family)